MPRNVAPTLYQYMIDDTLTYQAAEVLARTDRLPQETLEILGRPQVHGGGGMNAALVLQNQPLRGGIGRN